MVVARLLDIVRIIMVVGNWTSSLIVEQFSQFIKCALDVLFQCCNDTSTNVLLGISILYYKCQHRLYKLENQVSDLSNMVASNITPAR